MKDLITSVGSVMILMIFVLQFAVNQNVAVKFAISDLILESYEESFVVDKAENTAENIKSDISSVLNCPKEEVIVKQEENGVYIVSAPVKDIIACGELLGIKGEDNKTIYKKVIKADR